MPFSTPAPFHLIHSIFILYYNYAYVSVKVMQNETKENRQSEEMRLEAECEDENSVPHSESRKGI